MDDVHYTQEGIRRDALIRITFVAAPAMVLAYGVVRLIDGRDGVHGPGLAWTVGHSLFLVGLVLFGAVLVGLRRMVPAGARPRRIVADLATVVGFAGLLPFVRGIIIDIVAGIRAADRPEMERLSDRYHDIPGLLPSAYYDLGPVLFEIGLVALLVLLAAGRRMPWWSPVLMVLGFAVIPVNLDLLPLGGAIMGVALAPGAARRRVPAAGATRPGHRRIGSP